MRKYLGMIMSLFFITLIIALPLFYFKYKNDYIKSQNIKVGEKYTFNQESTIIVDNQDVDIENNEIKFNNSGKYTVIEKDKNGKETKYVFDVKEENDNSSNESSSEKPNNNTNNKPSSEKTNNETNDNITNNPVEEPNNVETNKVVEVTGVMLSKNEITIKVDDEENIYATVVPSNASNQTISWSSSNEKIVLVSQGKIKGIAVGKTTIIAKSNNGKSATITVTVENKTINVEKITLNKSKTSIVIGNTETLNATISPDNASNKSITWSSSNEKIASVSNGIITPKRTGKVTITALNSDGSIKASCEVTITGTRIHFISHLEATGSDHITGDAILLESNGYFAMIDAGNTNSDVVKNITTYLNDLNVTKLDFILFTHMHYDHAGNLQNLLKSGIKISNIWIKNYDVPEYQVNYVPNLNEDGIDIGLNEQVSDGNPYNNLNSSLARFKRILYIANVGKYKDLVTNIKYISDAADGKKYTFKNLDFSMTLYNNKLNVNTINSENYDSIISLIEINGYRILLTGDAYDTKELNTISSKIGKIDVLKLPHHGSRYCALLDKKYKGDKIDNTGTSVSSTALNSLKPTYFVITSSKKKIANIRNEYNLANGKMCVDKITSYSDSNKYYVDETNNALIVNLSSNKITFAKK